MRYTLPILLVLALLALPGHAAAQVVQPAQLAYIDAQVEIFDQRLAAYQAEYVAANGQYYQALASHSVAPASLTAPDDLTAHPTDQEISLAAVWTDTGLPVELGWSFQISTYNGPSGMGYTVTVSTVIDGQTWQRTLNHGPEDWRGTGWYLLTDW